MMTNKKKLEFISRIPIGTSVIAIRESDYENGDTHNASHGVFAGLRMDDGRDSIWLTSQLGSRSGQLVPIEEIHQLGIELDPSLRPNQARERIRR